MARSSGTATPSVVANLPYNVATPLVLHLLESVPQISRMLVMVQREVAERLAAHAGDDAYGAVSLRVQYFADARVVGRVPATVFLPRPRVDSSLVQIVRRPRVRWTRRWSARRRSLGLFAPRSRTGARCCAGRSPSGRARGSSSDPACKRLAGPRS